MTRTKRKKPGRKPIFGRAMTGAQRANRRRAALMDRGYVQVNVWLPQPLRDRLCALAKRTGKTLSEIAESTLHEFVEMRIR